MSWFLFRPWKPDSNNNSDKDCENKKRRDVKIGNGRYKCEFCGLIKKQSWKVVLEIISCRSKCTMTRCIALWCALIFVHFNSFNFDQNSLATLKSHYLVHSNEKNFYCEICGRAFKHYYNVITHSKKFHSKEPFLRPRIWPANVPEVGSLVTWCKTLTKEVTPRPITAEERKYLEKNFMVNISDPEGRQRNQTTTGCCSPTHHITSQPMVAQSQNHVSGEQVTYVQQQTTSNQYQQVHSSNKNPGMNWNTGF